VAPFWDALEQLRTWERNTEPTVAERVIRSLVADWPDQPALIYMLSHSHRRAHNEHAARVDDLGLLYKAIERFPAPAPHEHPEIRRLAACIVSDMSDVAVFRREDPIPIEVGPVRRMAERANYVEGWVGLVRYFRTMRQFPDAFEALDHMKGGVMMNEESVHLDKLASERYYTLIEARRLEDANALLKELPPDLALRLHVQTELGSERFAAAVALVDPAKVTDDATLVYYAEAQGELGRLDEARAILARLERKNSDLTLSLRGYLAELATRPPKKSRD
jgi:hypothetical protein